MTIQRKISIHPRILKYNWMDLVENLTNGTNNIALFISNESNKVRKNRYAIVINVNKYYVMTVKDLGLTFFLILRVSSFRVRFSFVDTCSGILLGGVFLYHNVEWITSIRSWLLDYISVSKRKILQFLGFDGVLSCYWFFFIPTLVAIH